MALIDTLSSLLGRSSTGDAEDPQYECPRCGETYRRPLTPCEECGSDVLQAID